MLLTISSGIILIIKQLTKIYCFFQNICQLQFQVVLLGKGVLKKIMILNQGIQLNIKFQIGLKSFAFFFD